MPSVKCRCQLQWVIFCRRLCPVVRTSRWPTPIPIQYQCSITLRFIIKPRTRFPDSVPESAVDLLRSGSLSLERQPGEETAGDLVGTYGRDVCSPLPL